MDWPLAIDKNRERLLRIVLALMASLGLVQDKRSAVVDSGKLATLKFSLYHKALAILRPAESAVRRLIMMAAYEMELRGIKLPKPRTKMFGERHATSFPNAANFAPSFNLIDQLKPFTDEAPDYNQFGQKFDPEGHAIERGPVPAAALARRILALKLALNAIPKQARRLHRWYATRDAARARNIPHRMSPLRPGYPPGYRKSRNRKSENHSHDIMSILLDCHYFAHETRRGYNSS